MCGLSKRGGGARYPGRGNYKGEGVGKLIADFKLTIACSAPCRKLRAAREPVEVFKETQLVIA